MSVKKRVDSIFHVSPWSYYNNAQKSKLPRYKFRPRIAELRGLEGIYDNPSFPDYPIHISCRFNDILRCGDTSNFVSCFRHEGEEKKQPFIRCAKNNWAIVFVTDKSGKYMGRTWISYERTSFGYDYLNVYRMYGNKLRSDDVTALLYKLVATNSTGRQVRIYGGQSDDYIPFS